MSCFLTRFPFSDARLREIYDRTGSVEDSDMAGDGDRDWAAYWRELFPRLTKKDFEDFAAKYRGSSLYPLFYALYQAANAPFPSFSSIRL